MPSLSEVIVANLYFSALLLAFSALLLLGIYFFRWKSDAVSIVLWSGSILISALGALLVTHQGNALIWGLGLIFLLFISMLRTMRIISAFGILFFISMLLPSLFSLAWLLQLGASLIKTLNVGTPAFAFLVLGMMSVAIGILLNTLLLTTMALMKYSELYFHFPRRISFLKKAAKTEGPYPWVSIHLPCYAEPPELVIESLNALANLNYPNFEVIVLDNNTQDSRLWKPVEEHCKRLGERFRFYHYDMLKGAKAGALNTALTLSDPKAEIIAIIDADYVVQPEFLEDYIGAFDDPKTGFVQTCHDYRQWVNSRYLSACYYEYLSHFKMILPALNEYDAAYTVGTMCLLRRKAIEEAGGWSEWCLTEDSEIAVRIHSLGYVGYYLKDTSGRGLIPETYSGYKNQRFRWVAGPIQQLQRHWRLYMPWLNQGKMTSNQKLGEIAHSSLYLFNELMYFVSIPFVILALWYSIPHHKAFYVPAPILLLIIVAYIRNVVANWIRIRLLQGNWQDYIYATIASRSLSYTSYLAFYTALLKIRISWIRTDKFKKSSNFKRAIYSSLPQFCLGLLFLIGVAALAPFASFWPPDFIFLIMLGFLNEAFTYFSAPFMAYLGEKELLNTTT